MVMGLKNKRMAAKNDAEQSQREVYRRGDSFVHKSCSSSNEFKY